MTAEDLVRAQYEALPYPERDPRDERKRLIIGSPSDLDEINHYVFAGRRNWNQPFRALVAGGGTGDGLILLAQRLADRGVPAEVTYLDLSTASRRIAEGRAAARGLDTIRFITGSLLDAGKLAPGPYDYIDCCGVLHHLDDPVAGLRALASVVSPGGGIGLMVYGALGRTGVYPIQTLLRTLAPPDRAPKDRVAVARRLLSALPPTNWLKHNPYLADHLHGGDAGLFDLLLHSRDRAYTVPEVVELCAAAGLRTAAFIEPARYEPATYLSDPTLRSRFAGLALTERAAAAELLAGNITKHVFYAVPESRPEPIVAEPLGPGAVPILRDERLRAGLKGQVLTAKLGGLALPFPLPRLAQAMLAQIDGRRTLAAIHDDLRIANPALQWEAFKAQFDELYATLNGLNKLVIAFPAVDE